MSLDYWNQRISHLPGASILQTSQWAEVKSDVGWEPIFKEWTDDKGKLQAAALILKRPLNLGRLHTGCCFLYVPRGPLLDWTDSVLVQRVFFDLKALAKEMHAVFIKIDPDVPSAFGVPGTESYRENPAGQSLLAEYRRGNWVFSEQQIQFANSVWIDLRQDEDTLLANMKQRTRYKVRLAEKKGVSVRHGTQEDLEILYQMYAETSARDGFIIRGRDYYMDVWRKFLANGMLTPLIAEAEGECLSALMLFCYANRAWYIYGMSRDCQREKMPNYLLQWEAMRTAREKGCKTYDLWGAPDEFVESDRMWGVFQFKRGLGGEVVITPGAWDLPINPVLYQAFVKVLPKLIARMRRKAGV